jgi:hypothetical protein
MHSITNDILGMTNGILTIEAWNKPEQQFEAKGSGASGDEIRLRWVGRN